MTAPQDASVLSGGFVDPAVQSAHAFRALLAAMARPGTMQTVTGAQPPAPLSVAAGVALLTLADPTVPVHLAGAADTEAVRAWIAFHCGAPLVAAERAAIALGTWDALQPVSRFSMGLPDYPDRSATLIVELPALTASGAQLRGPGIRDRAELSLPETAAFIANRARFPLGFDCLFTSGSTLAALPRSTIVENA